MMRFKEKVHEIIFEADTREGKLFDVCLLVVITLSLVLVMLESVEEINAIYDRIFNVLEWVFTFVFLLEYFLRIYSVKKPTGYIFSFFGIVDLLSILPVFLGLFIVGGHSFMIIRSLRLLRVFRVFKLVRFLGEARQISQALSASKAKIIVFLGFILTVVVILGTVMYIVETPESGFTSIPISIYWAIVTLTTVGYGDIAPQSVLGQVIASVVMILGYAVIAVPTGIVTNEIIQFKPKKSLSTQVCPSCCEEGHDSDAVFCKYCSEKL